MQMKKVVVISMLAAALGTTAVSPVMAQSANTQQAVQMAKTTFTINTNAVVIRTVVDAGATLASVRDLAQALGATLHVSNGSIIVKLASHTVSLKAGSKSIIINGKSSTLNHAVKNVSYTAFIEPAAFVKALGGTYTSSTKGPIVSTIQQLAAAEHAVWINASKLIVSNSVENGREDYLVEAATGKYEKLLTSSDTSELIVSPDSKKAAYSDALGAVYLLDLSTKKSTQISSDSSIKNELQWAKDGSSLFFLQGDKSSVIAKLNLSDGSVTKVLEDKVDYKANLDLSANGVAFTYSVIKQPKVTADSTAEVDLDDVVIDATGTEPQIYYYDSSVPENKPVQLTTDTNDKAFLKLSADGTKAIYVSLSNDEASLGQLISVDNTGKTIQTVFADRDVYQLTQGGGKLYLLTANDANSNAIYEIDAATGSNKRVQTVSDSVTEIFVSSDARLAALIDGKLAIAVNGTWKTITK